MSCNCLTPTSGKHSEEVWKGSTIKVLFNVTNLPDCTFADCEFSVDIWVSDTNEALKPKPESGCLHFTKATMVSVDDDTYIAEVKTGLLGNGFVMARLSVDMPDSEISSGWRTEIEQGSTGIKII